MVIAANFPSHTRIIDYFIDRMASEFEDLPEDETGFLHFVDCGGCREGDNGAAEEK